MNCGSLRATRRVAAQVSEVADRCASSSVPTAAETQAKLQADCGGGSSRVQRREVAARDEWSRIASGVCTTNRVHRGVTATD